MENRAKLAMSGAYDLAKGEFEILAITAGMGNGWNFTEEALKKSVPLWNGVDSFVDHGQFFERRSVRDLGGVGLSPEWDDVLKGVKLRLRCCGPSGPFMDALGREMCAMDDAPRIGFSADVGFTATGSDVQEILRVFSLDVVYDPARGGAFLRALNSTAPGRGKEAGMVEEKGKTTPDPEKKEGGRVLEQLQADLEAIRMMTAVAEEKQKLSAEAEAARAVRAQMCVYLLDSGLAASRLPLPMQESVRAQFVGRVFEPADLTAAIDAARELVGKLTQGQHVAGISRVSAVFGTEDQLQAAVDDLLRAPRNKGSENLQVAKLRGIREFYHMMTGDLDMHGGVYPERAQFQATTATFTGLVKNALNKALVDHWAQLGAAGYDWWKRVATVEHFDSLNGVTWTIFGSIGALPTVAEGAEYTELKIADSPETGTFSKYGGYVGITLEAMDRDDARALRAMPRELANGALRKISALVAALFTDNSGIGPTLADTGALFNSTAVTTAGGHKNLLTTALAAAEWEVVSAAVYNQPMLIANETGYYGTGAKMGVNPRFCLVPRALQLTAMKILYPSLENASNIYSENLQRGQPGDVVTVPEWTDATDWAAVVDPAVVPGIMIGERFGIMPEVFIAGDELSPAVFMNDESRIKVRHFVTVGVADFRPLHKSNV